MLRQHEASLANIQRQSAHLLQADDHDLNAGISELTKKAKQLDADASKAIQEARSSLQLPVNVLVRSIATILPRPLTRTKQKSRTDEHMSCTITPCESADMYHLIVYLQL